MGSPVRRFEHWLMFEASMLTKINSCVFKTLKHSSKIYFVKKRIFVRQLFRYMGSHMY